MRCSSALRAALQLPRRVTLPPPQRVRRAPAHGVRAMAAAPAPAGGDAAALVPPCTRDDGYRILSETVSFKRYITVYDRTVQFPAAAPSSSAAAPGSAAGAAAAAPPPSFAFDVVGHPRAGFHFVSVFPFHSGPEPAVTLVREFAQGPNHHVWSFPAGGLDAARHASLEDAAAAELSEECALRGGELSRLLPRSHPGLLESKWCRNRFTPFLCVDPAHDPCPGARDAEEAGMTVHRVPLARLEELLYSDDVLLPTAVTAQLALRELRRRGLLPHEEAAA